MLDLVLTCMRDRCALDIKSTCHIKGDSIFYGMGGNLKNDAPTGMRPIIMQYLQPSRIVTNSSGKWFVLSADNVTSLSTVHMATLLMARSQSHVLPHTSKIQIDYGEYIQVNNLLLDVGSLTRPWASSWQYQNV